MMLEATRFDNPLTALNAYFSTYLTHAEPFGAGLPTSVTVILGRTPLNVFVGFLDLNDPIGDNGRWYQ